MPLLSRSKTMMLTLATLLLGSGAGCGGSEGTGTSGTSTSSSTLSGGMGGAPSSSASGQGGSGGEDIITIGAGGTASGGMTSGTGMCDPKLVGVIRDFKGYPAG